jgi:putative oxidoreductase
MNLLEKLQLRVSEHPKFADLIRIVLGLILIWKGVAFILNLNVLHLYLQETGLNDSLAISVAINLLAWLIIVLNLLGGISIALNIQTRFFCWLTLPILFGAVFLINMHRGSFEIHTEFWLSLLSLLAIVFTLLIREKAYSHSRRVSAS